MKYYPLLLVLLGSAVCRPLAAVPSAEGTSEFAAASSASPVYVPALCTLMDREVRSEVPAGHPVILMWGWSAATEQQIQDYLRAATVRVTFDGEIVAGERQGGTPYDEIAKVYRAVWMAEVGVPAPGVHRITYLLTFAAKIFDGVEYYGPGTENEKQEDACEIEVVKAS